VLSLDTPDPSCIGDLRIHIDRVRHGIRRYGLIQLSAAFREPTACSRHYLHNCDISTDEAKLEIMVEDIWEDEQEPGHSW
jgi:hypothetical protein